jgi:hypothetical protein
VLDAVRAAAPVALHGVALDVGSTDPLDAAYLDALAALVRRVEPAIVSDHLCWTGVGGVRLHDLLPLPMNDDTVRHVAARVRRVQDRLGRRIALENVSAYVRCAGDALPEWDFVAAVAEEADCDLLLDVNNVFVNAHDHGFDAAAYLDALPPACVVQMHLAGHSRDGPLLVDTHDHPVCDGVWALYAHAVRRFGRVPTSIEWDDAIPPFETLVAEAAHARAILDAAAPADAA